MTSRPSLETSTLRVLTPSNITQQLSELSIQVHPFLTLSEFNQTDSLSLTHNNSAMLAELYHNLQEHHPEAGKSYWAHKCWQLTIWQPVLLSLICIYGLQTSLSLSRLNIHCHHLSIFGYKLDSPKSFKADTETMISHICSELLLLTQGFYKQISQVTSLKPLFCQKLLSDQLFEALAKVPSFIPNLNDDEFSAQTQLWLSELGLPKRTLNIQDNKEIVRQSCCLEYRLATNIYCSNCPKKRTKNNAEA